MSTTKTEVTIFEGERPTHTPDGKPIPAEWIIMNAPRPLLGQLEWRGDFGHGVFYVALDPNDQPYTDGFMLRNRQLDAYLCKWVTLEQMREAVLAYYAPDSDEREMQLLRDADPREIRQMFSSIPK